MKQITQEWLKSAESDFKLMDKIIGDADLTSQIAFHAQQAIEKLLKAILEEFEIIYPKTHSLKNLLARIPKDIIHISNDDLIILMEQLYIDARYPSALGLLPDGKPNIAEAQAFLFLATEIKNQIKIFFKVENYNL